MSASPIPGRDEIRERVRRVLAEHLSIRGVDDETRLVSELALDSIQQLTLVVELENEFRVRFQDEDERSIETLGDVIAAVTAALERERASAGGRA